MNSFAKSVFRAYLAERFCDEPEEQVSFVRFEEEENTGELFGLASEMLFGRIVYAKDSENQATEFLAVKRSADVCFENETDYYSMQFANEIHFFSIVVPTISTLTNSKFESFFPKFLYSGSKTIPGCNLNVIIYENLRALGFHMASSKKKQDSSSERDLGTLFLDYAHLSLMMRKLGRFHACSIAAAKINRNHFQLVASFQARLNENFMRKYSNTTRALMKKYIDLLSVNSLYKGKLASIEKIVENLENCLLSVNNNPKSISVLCHGDYTTFNVLFKYDKNGCPVDMKMLDLGFWRLSSPVLDLAHLLYINADQEMRDRHWNDLMDDYFKGLADILAVHDLPSRMEIIEEFRLSGWYVFLLASFFIVNRIAAAANVPNIIDVIRSHYPDELIANIPFEELEKLYKNNEVGGKRATETVLNILKDMVDRKFI